MDGRTDDSVRACLSMMGLVRLESQVERYLPQVVGERTGRCIARLVYTAKDRRA